jgi:site-specific DNA-methyltransferase (adenine-specific)
MFELNRLYNLDCMDAMRHIPDKYFALAICDPPYGIGQDGQKQQICANPKHNRKYHKRKGWDRQPPPREYFAELERVSVNQIIWGGNYFVPMLNKGTKGWIVWDKGQHGLTMSDCELAYTSFDCPTRVVIINRAQLMSDGDTIHPTQKPVKLYRWLLQHYAKDGDRIIDTHAGSASSLIACHDMYFDFVGFEIDPEYYAAANERLISAQSQLRLFDIAETSGGGIIIDFGLLRKMRRIYARRVQTLPAVYA